MRPYRLANGHCLQKKQRNYVGLSLFYHLGVNKKLCKTQMAVIRKRMPPIDLTKPPQWVNVSYSYGEKT